MIASFSEATRQGDEPAKTTVAMRDDIRALDEYSNYRIRSADGHVCTGRMSGCTSRTFGDRSLSCSRDGKIIIFKPKLERLCSELVNLYIVVNLLDAEDLVVIANSAMLTITVAKDAKADQQARWDLYKHFRDHTDRDHRHGYWPRTCSLSVDLAPTIRRFRVTLENDLRGITAIDESDIANPRATIPSLQPRARTGSRPRDPTVAWPGRAYFSFHCNRETANEVVDLIILEPFKMFPVLVWTVGACGRGLKRTVPSIARIVRTISNVTVRICLLGVIDRQQSAIASPERCSARFVWIQHANSIQSSCHCSGRTVTQGSGI